jgi:hypothetical protein
MDYLTFADSVFNDREGRYLEIAEEMVRREVHVPWMAFFRPSHFDAAEAALLQRSGLRSVEWGTDCATQVTLDAMGKGFSWGEVEESNRVFAQAGIANAHFVMFGGPGETHDTVRQGLANLEALADCVVFAFCGVRILPDTGIHRHAVDTGQISEDDSLLEPRFYFAPDLDGEWLDAEITRSFGSRPDRIFPPGRDMAKIKAFHRFGYRGPVWDMLLAKGRERKGRG